MMPSQFTAGMSLEDAEQLAENLHIRYDVQTNQIDVRRVHVRTGR